MIRYGLRYPLDPTLFPLIQVEALVGTKVDVSCLGEKVGTARVTSARQYDDPLLGPGVWVEVEADAPEAEEVTKDPGAAWSVQEARIRRLDADGNPVGPWTTL